VKTVYPALAAQFILLMLGSSVVAAISARTSPASPTRCSRALPFVRDLFRRDPDVSAMTLAFQAVFAALYWYVFRRNRPVEGLR